MFGRSTKEKSPGGKQAASEVTKEGGKGRPTPTRKEAEAAARARAKGPTDKKGAARQQRERRADAARQAREGMRAGDERYFPQRDKGPVKKAVRDFIDSRLTVAEFMLPVLFILIMMSFSRNSALGRLSSSLELVVVLLVAIDSVFWMFLLRRKLRSRFEPAETRRVAMYAFTRALQMRFMRLPKPTVKIGGAPK